jgi:hypothetical protein
MDNNKTVQGMIEAENKKVSLQDAIAQIKRFEDSQSKAFEAKRRKQRNGLIRSNCYGKECLTTPEK